jgi:MFS family permease
MERRSEDSYGWVVVAVGIVITCVGFGAMLTLSVFLQPMADAMGWSRSAIAAAAMLNFLCMGLGAFAWGSLSDRYGTRAVVLCGGALLGLGMVLASRSTSLLQFQILFGVIVGVASGSFYAPLTATTAKWFTVNRSLAVALVSAGLSVGSAVMAPLSRWLISTYDWRTAMLVIGDLVWLVIIPASFLVRNPPSVAPSAAAARAAAAGPNLTIGQVLRTPQFAAIAFTHFACCAAHSGPIFHMVTHAIDRGVPAMAAATVLSAAGLASLSGKIGCGIFADRVGAKRTLLAGLAIQAVAISLYLFTGSLGSFYALALMFGFAYGGVMPLYAILVREHFGERVMGSAFGAVSLAATLGMALGPWLGGALFDAVGSYAWMFIGSSAIGVGAVAIAFTLRSPRALQPALLTPSASTS